MSRRHPPPPRPDACLNCGSTAVEAFCPRCGQRNVDVRVPARDLVVDAIEDGLSLDSRMGRTVLPFLFRPGFLTTEWTAGRRARYSSPLRLFLLTSFVFFLSTSLGFEVGPALREAGQPGAAAAEGVEAGLAGAREGIEAGLRAAAEEQDADAGEPGAAVAEAGSTRPDAAPSVTFRPGEPVPRGTADQHESLRKQGWLGRTVDDRWQAFEGMTQEQALTRVQVAFREWVPRVTFFLVPAAVLVLLLLWPRRWLSEHIVLSLHLHAFAFTVFTALLLVRHLPSGVVRSVLAGVLWASIPAWFLFALRRVFGQGWRWTILKAGVAAVLYLLALGVGLAGVGLVALYVA